jgi:hypothetical protein
MGAALAPAGSRISACGGFRDDGVGVAESRNPSSVIPAGAQRRAGIHGAAPAPAGSRISTCGGFRDDGVGVAESRNPSSVIPAGAQRRAGIHGAAPAPAGSRISTCGGFRDDGLVGGGEPEPPFRHPGRSAAESRDPWGLHWRRLDPGYPPAADSGMTGWWVADSGMTGWGGGGFGDDGLVGGEPPVGAGLARERAAGALGGWVAAACHTVSDVTEEWPGIGGNRGRGLLAASGFMQPCLNQPIPSSACEPSRTSWRVSGSGLR